MNRRVYFDNSPIRKTCLLGNGLHGLVKFVGIDPEIVKALVKANCNSITKEVLTKALTKIFFADRNPVEGDVGVSGVCPSSIDCSVSRFFTRDGGNVANDLRVDLQDPAMVVCNISLNTIFMSRTFAVSIIWQTALWSVICALVKYGIGMWSPLSNWNYRTDSI